MKILVFSAVLAVLAACGAPTGMQAFQVQASEVHDGIFFENRSKADPASSDADNSDEGFSPSPWKKKKKPEKISSAPEAHKGEVAPTTPVAPPAAPAPAPAPAPTPVPGRQPVVGTPVQPPVTQPPVQQEPPAEPPVAQPPAPVMPIPVEVRKDKTTVSLPTPQSEPKDFIFKGKVVPSIYYMPLLVDNERTCNPNQTTVLRGAKSKDLMRICRKNYNKCLLEGSCRILRDHQERSFNIAGGSPKSPLFKELGDEDCFFGMGVRNICLDPFYTVAADMRYFRPGDVIYIPTLVGEVLPNNEKHNGFMIVRDTGGAILGPNRFDFFSGSMTWQNPDNSFAQIKLNDKRTRYEYYLVRGETAKKVLAKRNFPLIPPAN